MSTCPQCGHVITNLEQDGRTAAWRVRIRLYSDDRAEEPDADTDPDLAPAEPGNLIIHGLPGVCVELRGLATIFHACAVTGLDDRTLRHKLKSLRPTLSRRKGNAVWRINYTVPGKGEKDATWWLARVDLVRVEKETAPG